MPQHTRIFARQAIQLLRGALRCGRHPGRETVHIRPVSNLKTAVDGLEGAPGIVGAGRQGDRIDNSGDAVVVGGSPRHVRGFATTCSGRLVRRLHRALGTGHLYRRRGLHMERPESGRKSWHAANGIGHRRHGSNLQAEAISCASRVGSGWARPWNNKRIPR
jgi:hypothetical protein